MMSEEKFVLMIVLLLFVLVIGTLLLSGEINRQGKNEIGKFISAVNLNTLQGIHS